MGGELWVSASNGLYKLTGAGSRTVEGGGISVTPMSSTTFPNGAGGIVFNSATGTIYAVALNGPLPSGVWLDGNAIVSQLTAPEPGAG
jgi:hypothetical protein